MGKYRHYNIPDFYFYSYSSADHVVMEGRGDDTLAKSAGFKYSLSNGGVKTHYFVELSEAEAFLKSVQGEQYYEEIEELRKLTRSSKKDAADKNRIPLDKYENRVKLIKDAVKWQRRLLDFKKQLSTMYKERTGEEYDYSQSYVFYELVTDEKRLAKQIEVLPYKISKNLQQAADPPYTTTLNKQADMIRPYVKMLEFFV